MRIVIEVEKPPSRRKKISVEVIKTWNEYLIY